MVKFIEVPEITPEMVTALLPPTLLCAAKVMLPEMVAAVELLLMMAPFDEIPVPLRLIALPTVVPLRSNTAPDATVTVAVPNGPLVGGLAPLELPDLR